MICQVDTSGFQVATMSKQMATRLHISGATDVAVVRETLDCHETQDTYWELQNFFILALKTRSSVLKYLYSPIVEKATWLTDELLSMRSMFVSRLVNQTYNGYVTSQSMTMQADIRNQGQTK